MKQRRKSSPIRKDAQEAERPLVWPEGYRNGMVAHPYYRIENWPVYAEGYKKAADHIVSHVRETGMDHDFFVFPVLFLYRQYLELAMKAIMVCGRKLLGDDPKVDKTHNLARLWNDCKGIILRIWPTLPESLEPVDECIKQFEQIDPTSFNFRYPINNEGGPSLTQDIRVDLEACSRMVDKAGSLLDKPWDDILVRLDIGEMPDYS